MPIVRINATVAFSTFLFDPSSLRLWDGIASARTNTYFACFLGLVGNMVWITDINNRYPYWRTRSESAETTSRVCHYLG
jgi:hypothetical protein